MDLPFGITWLVLGGGIAGWFFSATLAARKAKPGDPKSTPTPVRVLGWISILAIILGAYAGFKGPLDVGPVSLPQFAFAKTLGKGDVLGLRYARANLFLTRKPSHGWHGDSATSMQYTVHNSGNRNVSFIIVRFHTTSGAKIDEKVHGPFQKGRTVQKTVKLPEDAKPSYMKPTSKIDPDHIVGASF